MVVLEFKGVELDFCLDCRGCWLDHGELELIAGAATAGWALEHSSHSARRCPRCGQRMQEGRFPGTAVPVDACTKNRHGVWLDQGELQAIVASRADAGAAGALAAFCADVFGEKLSTQNRQTTD